MSDERRTPDDLERRLQLAVKRALIASAPPMPADLKAELMRMARARAPRASLLSVLRESLSARPWAYGAGAAFAAAGLMIVLRFAEAPVPAAAPVARAVPDDAPPPLADLWTDDDGGDEDEG